MNRWRGASLIMLGLLLGITCTILLVIPGPLGAQSGPTLLSSLVRVFVDPDTGEISLFLVDEGEGATPTPSVTPPQATTPPASATPTQEVGLPTTTPGSPTPPPLVCSLIVAEPTRIRSGPGTRYDQVDSWPTGVAQTAQQFASADNYLWAQLGANRWAAIKVHPIQPPDSGWWAYGYESSRDLCLDVPGWPSELSTVPPPPIAGQPTRPLGVGWTLMYGYDAPAVAAAGSQLQLLGYQPSLTLTDNAPEACSWQSQGWMTNVRPWYQLGLGDHPDLTYPAAESARLRVASLATWVETILAPCQYEVTIQLTNETVWPDAGYLRDWILEAVRLCEVRGWTCMPVVFSTGTPEERWMPTLVPALQALRSGGHYFGYNAYPYQRDLMLCDAAQEWTTWRPTRLIAASGLDAQLWPDIWVTEAARGSGDVEPIVSDSRCYIDRAEEEGIYAAINLWYAGGDSVWRRARWLAEKIILLIQQLG